MNDFAFDDLDDLRREMSGMDEAEQRRFVRRLAMETHVQLHQHLKSQEPMHEQFAAVYATMFRVEPDGKVISKLDEVHKALFDKDDGLVNLRSWMCRIATRGAALLLGIAALAASIASIGHNFGWWGVG